MNFDVSPNVLSLLVFLMSVPIMSILRKVPCRTAGFQGRGPFYCLTFCGDAGFSVYAMHAPMYRTNVFIHVMHGKGSGCDKSRFSCLLAVYQFSCSGYEI